MHDVINKNDLYTGVYSRICIRIQNLQDHCNAVETKYKAWSMVRPIDTESRQIACGAAS